MAKYIVHQYIAAMGGEHALNSIDSMYAMGKENESNSDLCFYTFFFFKSLLVTANDPEARLGCTDAYFGN